MPTYDYVCENCEHKFEQFQSITAKNLKKCPECGKMNLKRLIGSGSGIVFKGSGFYQTDYRTESYKQDKEKAKAESKPKENKSETKAGPKKKKKESGDSK